MTLPRRILAGQTLLVTRRCSRRSFFLKPTRRVTEVFLYSLLHAAEETGIQLHALVVLSNHYHFVLTDPRGSLPKFMQRLNSLVARALNQHHGRSESFWSPGSYSKVELHDRASILDKLVYTLTNPVKDGLVSRPDLWPGLRTRIEDMGTRVLSARRPRHFFRQEWSKLPEAAELRVTVPPAFKDMDLRRLHTLVGRLVASRIAEIKAQRRAAGKRSFLGRRAIQRQDPLEGPTDRPPTARERASNPTISCKDRQLYAALLAELNGWRREYREAWERWRQGERRVKFPAGTYWMRVVYRARCGPPRLSLVS